MNDSRIECPYCGELIVSGARKCRHCGEWLQEESSGSPQQSPVKVSEPLEVVTVDEGYSPMAQPNSPQYMQQMPNGQIYPGGTQQPYLSNHPNMGTQQNIVVQPNIVIENNQEQNVNVETTVVTGGGNAESGLLWAQVLGVAIGVGIAMASFWYGVAALIILGICVFIPIIGPALCVVLGLASGALAGLIAAAFGAPTWVCWLIGIVGAIGLVYSNLEDGDHI